MPFGSAAAQAGRRGARTAALLLALASCCALHVTLGLAGAAAQTGSEVDAEAQFTARIASERQAAGRAPLAVEADLVAVARRHSARMVAAGRVYHNPALGDEVQNWVIVGENVGRGSTVDQVHAALMASSTHRGEILNERFTGVGVGVVQSGGSVWVTQVFRQATAAPVPAPQPAAPAPAEPARSEVPAAAPPEVAPAPAPAAAPAPGPATAARVAPAPRPARALTPPPTAASTTTTTTTTAPPSPPIALASAAPEVAISPLAAASSSPLPVPPVIPDAGVLAATLLWAVVAGLARVTLQLRTAPVTA